MYRTLSANAYTGTQGAHIIISQEGAEDAEQRRFVILSSDTLETVREFEGDSKEDVEAMLVELAREHLDKKSEATDALVTDSDEGLGEEGQTSAEGTESSTHEEVQDEGDETQTLNEVETQA